MARRRSERPRPRGRREPAVHGVGKKNRKQKEKNEKPATKKESERITRFMTALEKLKEKLKEAKANQKRIAWGEEGCNISGVLEQNSVGDTQ